MEPAARQTRLEGEGRGRAAASGVLGATNARGGSAIDRTAFETALRRIGERAPVVMILGGAGTGKTTLLHELRRRSGGRDVFLAPTGVAAVHLGGQTIHSFFAIPPRIVNLDDVQPRARTIMRGIERVVIDEISMVRCDLLDVVSRCLQLARLRPEPFGGVQMVLVGDFLQLPPVVPPAEEDILLRMGFRGPYAFDAKALREVQFARVSLRRVFRQTDEVFVEHLARVRRGEAIRETLDAINSLCCHPHRRENIPVVLAPTNFRADAYNRHGLAALPGPSRCYAGEIKGEFDIADDRLPVPPSLELKAGARVMTVRNDPARRWVNGSLGTVMELAPARAWVRLDAGRDVEIERATWERARYVWNSAEARVESKVTGTYTQLPLVHAWASTVHKAQGMTLDDVRIDFDRGAFAPGQAYVALSRARSPDGLSLARPLRASDIRVDPRVAAFTRSFEAA